MSYFTFRYKHCGLCFKFHSSSEQKHSNTWNCIKPCPSETSSSLWLIRGLHSPALPQKLWVSPVNIRFQAPAVFRVNERSVMHATCWLQTGSFAYQFSIAHPASAVVTVASPGALPAPSLIILAQSSHLLTINSVINEHFLINIPLQISVIIKGDYSEE